MAKGKKTGGRDIQKGQVLNPNGRPRVPDDLKSARKMNKTKFERLLNKYLSMSASELATVINDPSTSSLDMIVCQVIVRAVNNGDYLRLNFLLDRLIGKAKDVVEHSNPDGNFGAGRVIVLPNNNRGKNESDN